jgi:hypothetical protein
VLCKEEGWGERKAMFLYAHFKGWVHASISRSSSARPHDVFWHAYTTSVGDMKCLLHMWVIFESFPSRVTSTYYRIT